MNSVVAPAVTSPDLHMVDPAVVSKVSLGSFSINFILRTTMCCLSKKYICIRI